MYTFCKHLYPEGHRFNKFATGNLKTLNDDPLSKGVDVQHVIKHFIRENYNSNNMNIILIGDYEIETMT